jgi:prepilin-type N-terminal cleavage/methylation domain-containing protein
MSRDAARAVGRPRQGPAWGQRGVTLVELAITIGLFGIVMVGVVTVWTKAQEGYFVGAETAEVQQNVRAAIDFMVREIRSAGRDYTACAFDYQGTGTGTDCTAAKVAQCQLRIAGNWNTNNGLAGGGAGCTNLFAIPAANATATTIQIRSDRNGNGRIVGMGNSDGTDGGEEDVLYALSTASCPSGVAQCITRDDGTGPVAMVAVDINGFTITYFPKPGFGPCVGVGSPPVPPNPCPAFTLPLTDDNANNIGKIRISVTAQQTTVGTTISRTLVTDITLMNRS